VIYDQAIAVGLRVPEHGQVPLSHDDPRSIGSEGITILSWLAAHPKDRVIILLGNHDAARVMELVTVDDARFDEAHQAAVRVRNCEDPEEKKRLESQFLEEFPDLPTVDLAARDFSSYSTEQRALVMRLLLEGRMDLAAVGQLSDGPAVLWP